MENYETIFHSSSSTHSPVAGSYLSLLNMVNSHAQAHLHDHNKANYEYSKEILSSIGPAETEVRSSKEKGEKKSRKSKYAFQTRSQVDILDDGYKWRKYGQKAVKNNKFPRSYYRCTYQGCNVKKQIQRLSKDEGIVVTTYEGMHSHPIEKSSDSFQHILSQMHIYSSV